jgi:hypothetical protein
VYLTQRYHGNKQLNTAAAQRPQLPPDAKAANVKERMLLVSADASD